MTGYESKRAAAQDKLAQPAQEPVAWLEPEWGEKICPEVGYEVTMTDDHPKDLGWIPLVAQRTWVGLTNNELQPIADEYRILFGSWVEDFARAIEAKLKEKNNG